MRAKAVIGTAVALMGLIIVMGFFPLTTVVPVDDDRIIPVDDGNGTAPPTEDAEIAQDYWQMFGAMLLVSGVIIAYSDDYKEPRRG